MFVLITAIPHAWKHTMGFGGNFDSSSLSLPLHWFPADWFGGESIKLKLRYMYMSLLVGVVLCIIVSFELILRQVIELFAPDRAMAPPPDPDLVAAD